MRESGTLVLLKKEVRSLGAEDWRLRKWLLEIMYPEQSWKLKSAVLVGFGKAVFA